MLHFGRFLDMLRLVGMNVQTHMLANKKSAMKLIKSELYPWGWFTLGARKSTILGLRMSKLSLHIFSKQNVLVVFCYAGTLKVEYSTENCHLRKHKYNHWSATAQEMWPCKMRLHSTWFMKVKTSISKGLRLSILWQKDRQQLKITLLVRL